MAVASLSHRSGAAADIDLLGATIFSWRPAGGGELLFVSGSGRGLREGPLRGGIPVVFPQFAERGPLPLHGFAHSQPWECLEAGAARATLRLADNAASRALWPHPFELQLSIVLGESRLSVALDVHNSGRSAFDFCAALHTYLRVGNVERISVHGVAGAMYEERDAPNQRHVYAASGLQFPGPLDRIYVGLRRPLRLVDPLLERSIEQSQTGFEDVVIWNPGREEDVVTPFLQSGEYRQMVCVEAAQVISPIRLAPSARWHGTQSLDLA